MRLYEEYLMRHNMLDVPLAHHCDCASLVLNVENNNFWSILLEQNTISKMPKYAILHIKWDHNNHHPGQYLVNCFYPKHNSYNSDSIFQNHHLISIKWHEYESYILSYLVNKLKGIKPLRGFLPTTLAAWEMFVYACDGWFNKQSGDIKYLLFESLDNENSFETRWEVCQEILKRIQYAHPAINRCWKYDVCGKINSNAEWLANLIEEQCTRNILQLG